MTDSLQQQLQLCLGSAYTIERELGGGGMARVFVAEDTRLRRRVVVKVLAADLAAGMSSDRFEREIQLAAALQHPHIVPVLAAGETTGETDGGTGSLPYYIMPFVDGESLRARMLDRRLPPAFSISVLRDVAEALAYAHRQGIVHRDIKPENVLLTGESAVVTDFGIAKALSVSKTAAPGGTLTVVGTSLGTPAYMAPEQAAGDPDVDYRADLYAWGVVAYELLAGKHPFASRHTPQQLLAAHLAERPASLLDQLPRTEARDGSTRHLAALVMSCLEKEPSARPENAGAILGVLDAVATPGGAVRSGARGTGSRRTVYAALGVALVAGVIAAATFLGRPSGTPTLEPKRVVVATFENRSGDRSLDPVGLMAADWIARGLAASGLVDVAGTAAELVARGGTMLPTSGPAALRVLATEAKAGLVISGAYYKQGDSILFRADFTDANADKLVQSVGTVSASTARPLDGVERLRQRVTAGLATLLDSNLAGLAGVTNQPPNIDAYREFLEGEDLFYKDDNAAVAHYARASALDSSYVYPLLRAANALTNAGRFAAGDSVGRIVAGRRDRMSPYEQAYLDYVLAFGRADGEGAYRASLSLQRAAPKSAFATYIRGIMAMQVGRPREMDSVFKTLDPASGALRGRIYFFTNYSIGLHALGEFDRELELAKRAREQYPKRLILLDGEVMALAGLGRVDRLNALMDEAGLLTPELRRTPISTMTAAIHELRFHGHADAARVLAARLVAWVESHPAPPMDTVARYGMALGLIAAERWDLLRPLAASLGSAESTDAYALGVQGISLAMSGDRAGAARIASRLGTGDQYTRDVRLEMRAGIAAALGDLPAAFDLFHQGHPAAVLDVEYGHGTWIFDRLRDYPALKAYLKPRG